MPSLTQTDDRQQRHALSDHGAGHSSCAPGNMRVVGYVPLSAPPRADCQRPLRAVCRECDHVEEWRCDSYRCPPCGETKRRRLTRLIEDGSGQHLENGMHGYFLTLTPPGENDHRRWYQGKRPPTRPDCDCHQHGQSKGQWNRGESANWNRLRTTLARDCGIIFASAVEVQDGKRRSDGVGRSMLHRHVVLFADETLTYPEVQQAAIRAGYGCVVDVEPLQNAAKAGKYLAKYVTKSSASRDDVPWSVMHVDYDTGEITERQVTATYRLWSAAHRWGITMKVLKQIAGAQARARAGYLSELQAALTDEKANIVQASEPHSDQDPPAG